MKKITTSLLLLLLGCLSFPESASAQSDAILVPTFQNRSEMPARIKPEQKLLKELPFVIINENGIDFSQFKKEMMDWKTQNPSKLAQFESSINEFILKNEFDKLAEALVESGHSKEIALINYKGGNHE